MNAASGMHYAAAEPGRYPNGADGPSDKAGLRRGDLVIAVDERPVEDPQALLEVVDAARVGTPLPLKLLRNGREVNLSVKPAPLPGLA